MAPPVMAARAWLADHVPRPDRPLLNMSQAAPTAPPPEGLRRAIAAAALDDVSAHLYGPVLGLPALRAALAAQWAADYGGTIRADQVAITAGCNQAFCAAIATLAGPGDQVILPYPWYFNHKMWLDMAGVEAVPLACGPDLLPDPDRAAALITDRTRAIVLVTPNNPCGVEYPAALVRAFSALARDGGPALILDETYRNFDARPLPPHDLFADPDWDARHIHLYSFSKAFRLTGHRVGALIASPARLAEAEKFLDTVTICPNQLGQRAALWGLQNLRQWLAGERAEILARRDAMAAGFAELPGWRLLGCGAYFAYAAHPFGGDAETVARALLAEQSVLTLPGTMFAPEGDAPARRQIRFAFANADRAGIAALFDRLAAFTAARGGGQP
jgi:aspartate/methionine/tyrosine aminotransferase